jgi:phage I-like protein
MDSKDKSQAQNEGEFTALKSSLLAAGEVPARIVLAPWGEVESTAGCFVVDEEAARLVVEAFTEHGTDVPIDYEHQTLGGTYASPNGQAPAAGWIKSLQVEAGVGIVALIEWTEPARKLLGSKQYRYLSPVAIVRKSDRKLVAIHSAALTNKPAIVGMKPIVNRVEADETTVMAAPLEALRGALELTAEAAPEEVLIAASEELVQLRHEARGRRVRERVEAALRSGRLVEAQREWAESLAMRDEVMFDKWLETAPVIVATGRLAPPDAGSARVGERGAAERARAEYRAHPFLAGVTSEEAYVADATRTVFG